MTKEPSISSSQLRLWGSIIAIIIVFAGIITWSAKVSAQIDEQKQDILDLKANVYLMKEEIKADSISNAKIQAKLDYISENVDRINVKLEN